MREFDFAWTMPLTLGAIAYVSLLLVNSIAVLSHDRFLVPLGFVSATGANQNLYGANSYGNGFESYGNVGNVGEGEGPGVKQRAVALVGAVRTLMRSACPFSTRPTPADGPVPLIPINILVIVYEILLG